MLLLHDRVRCGEQVLRGGEFSHMLRQSLSLLSLIMFKLEDPLHHTGMVSIVVEIILMVSAAVQPLSSCTSTLS